MKTILIVGGGAAGLSAAVTAAELGAKTLVFEKNKILGGNGRFAEGVFGAGSRLQKRLNIEADPEKLYKEAMIFSHWRSDAALTRTLIEASGETIDWLMEEGVPFSRVIHHMPGQNPEVFHMTDELPTGSVLVSRLEKRVEELGVQIEKNTVVKSLLIRDGSVQGVILENGCTVEGDAVLVCTGGFAGNEELMCRLVRNYEKNVYRHFKGILCYGDGVEMVEKAGACIENDVCVEGAGPVYCGSGAVGALVRNAESIWLNDLGERFADETIVNDFIFGQNALARQPHKRGWAVFDASTVERLMESEPAFMLPVAVKDNGFSHLKEIVERETEPYFFKADTLEELTEKMGLKPGVLAETIGKYNESCENGKDFFGKEKRFLKKIEKAPYYAARCCVDKITTHGGIKVNHRFEVLDRNSLPIPNLYSAGVDISGIDSNDYSVMLSGHAFGFALAGGRKAVLNILEK